MARIQKAMARKLIISTRDYQRDGWQIKAGRLKRGKGRPTQVEHLFTVAAGKLPFFSLDAVRQHAENEMLQTNRGCGVYMAHDSMGCPRSIGRGRIFERLKSHAEAHPPLLIRAAVPLLHFNDRVNAFMAPWFSLLSTAKFRIRDYV